MRRLWRKPAREQIPVRLDQRSLYALAALLFLSQVPHLLHLPIWVSAMGVSIVALKLFAHHKPSRWVNYLLSPISLIGISVCGAVLRKVCRN